MIFLEILVAIFVGFLVYKFILMPNFSTKKLELSQVPKSFNDVFSKFNSLDFSEIISIKKKLILCEISRMYFIWKLRQIQSGYGK